MTDSHPGYRIFILGAGFSRPAGLPLGCELFTEVNTVITDRYGYETKYQRDLEDYLEYRELCEHQNVKATEIDLEDFLSYLDLEHFLELRGSDTWSDEGNESQLMIRKAIGEVISRRTPDTGSLPEIYLKFAEQLTLKDTILSLNYDVLLERALDKIKKPYRLFPNRFKSVGEQTQFIDNETDEVLILKLHGSVDWFDHTDYLRHTKSRDKSIYRQHRIFENSDLYNTKPLVNGPRPKNDLLQNIFRVGKIQEYYAEGLTNAPFLLSPSHVKFIYAKPLLSFWHGMGQNGGLSRGISVIGFSLPDHDKYIKIALYKMISNYQKCEWEDDLFGVRKSKVKFIDFRTDESSEMDYKKRFAFVNREKAEFFFDGFNESAVDFLFDHSR